MPVKDIVIDLFQKREKMLLENTEIPESTRAKRLSDIHRLIGELVGKDGKG